LNVEEALSLFNVALNLYSIIHTLESATKFLLAILLLLVEICIPEAEIKICRLEQWQ